MCKYLIVWLVEGKLYTFATPLCSGSISCVYIVHSFAPLFLHPWSTGGLLIVMVSVPSLWIVTPLLPDLKTVVYPFSAILFTLKSDLLVLVFCWLLLLWLIIVRMEVVLCCLPVVLSCPAETL